MKRTASSRTDKMLVFWSGLILIMVHLAGYTTSTQTNSCSFNSMCYCSSDQHDPYARTISDVSCVSVPFYKLPSLPEGNITQLEIAGSRISSLEAECLAGCQIYTLTLTNNKLQHVAERAFSSMYRTLTSLDMSYNELDAVPFMALKEIRNLQWINLHGNQIQALNGDWSHLRNTLVNLFIGENDITEVPLETNGNGAFDYGTSKTHHGLRQFKSLIWLNMDGNRLTKIHKHSLPSSLQTVSVSHNLIETFPVEIVSTLPRLQWLYLRGNHIRALPEHTFAKKLWLEKIDLGENYLHGLPRSPFNNSVYVRDLNLAFNDMKTLTDESFAGLQCGRIIVSYNQLETVEGRAFHGIQDHLEYLDLDHNNFVHLPYAITQLKSLKYLYLSSNALTEMPDGAFDSFCHVLKAISFSGNHLTRIPADALQNCTRISHFNVGYNEIYDVDGSDFADWGVNVRSLILANNRISNLRAQIFADLAELRELSLSFNSLRYVDRDAFAGLENLESLEISFVLDRDDLPHDLFKPTTNLQWLSADNNNFNVLYDYTLDYLPSLKYLNLESNNIDSIPTNMFKSGLHAKLKDVRFTNNEIFAIRTGTFDGLPNLETIVLSTNHIKSIQKYSFVDLPNLRTIILSDNMLKHVSAQSFANLPNLCKVDLQNNLLRDFSFSYFANVSIPLRLNLSRNEISACNADQKILNIEILDLRYNNIANIPKCLENTSLLTRLHLDFNIISNLEQNTFMHLTSLEELTLQQNNVLNVNRRAFFGLQNLQFLDLSKNLLTQLHVNQFSNMPKLRILKLNGNNINYLPKDIFSNTVLEMLDLSYNSFSVVPSLSLSDVGLTLRRLTIRSNNIEHIDSTTFPDMPYLQNLDLSTNKLTILPDNAFTSLGLLQKLDISTNPLRANFKELFHYAQSLKELNLANSSITSTPSLPLPNLIFLNLSHNNIEIINRNTVQDLYRLKYFDLSHNHIISVPNHLWIHLPLLKTLDLSYNPIKVLAADNFQGLRNLQNLKILGLSKLEKFDYKAVAQIKILNSLTMQTWPKVENFKMQLCSLFANLHQLRILKLTIEETVLDDQLSCIANRKIRQLEITGRHLKVIDRDAFNKFTKNPDLILKITGTEVEELPAGIFSNMYKISYLNIDLSKNMLTFLNPEIFYGNVSTWKTVGTTLITGGLKISDNPFRCGCHLSGLGHWLRRWMRESMQSHNAPVESAMQMNEIVKEATCTDIVSGVRIPIVQLPPEDLSCHASALSTASNSNKRPVMTMFVIYVSLVLFDYVHR